MSFAKKLATATGGQSGAAGGTAGEDVAPCTPQLRVSRCGLPGLVCRLQTPHREIQSFEDQTQTLRLSGTGRSEDTRFAVWEERQASHRWLLSVTASAGRGPPQQAREQSRSGDGVPALLSALPAEHSTPCFWKIKEKGKMSSTWKQT